MCIELMLNEHWFNSIVAFNYIGFSVNSTTTKYKIKVYYERIPLPNAMENQSYLVRYY